MFKKIINFLSLYGKDILKKNKTGIKNICQSKDVKRIFSILSEEGNENHVRFVGGCVRKFINGESIDDIDLATIYKPNEVKEKLSGQGIQVIETGIRHGTVTALFNNLTFEITTLREDIENYGRHAKVEFTKDWTKDASRRDLTINAIYMDINQNIFDPFDGVKDLKNGVVKFIGDSETRIKEDYIRIIRYLRFYTLYSKNEHSSELVETIKRNLNGLNIISNERILLEIKKILLLDKVEDLFNNDVSCSILLTIFPQFKYYDRIKRIKNKIQNISFEFMLSLLMIDTTDSCEFFLYKYKLSNKQKNIILFLLKNYRLKDKIDFFGEKNLNKFLYYNEKKLVGYLLLLISEDGKFNNDSFKYLFDKINNFEKPKFPITGNYLKTNFNFKEGKELGEVLENIENYWILNGFKINDQEIKDIIAK